MGARLGDSTADLRKDHSSGRGPRGPLASAVPREPPLVLARMWDGEALARSGSAALAVSPAGMVTGIRGLGQADEAPSLDGRRRRAERPALLCGLIFIRSITGG